MLQNTADVQVVERAIPRSVLVLDLREREEPLTGVRFPRTRDGFFRDAAVGHGNPKARNWKPRALLPPQVDRSGRYGTAEGSSTATGCDRLNSSGAQIIAQHADQDRGSESV
jgi:hypothetical protein